MNTMIKKLTAGGDKEVEKMLDTASLLGINLIELLWRAQKKDVTIVVGFQYPIIGNLNPHEESVSPSEWKEDILHFYPDAHEYCWGYVYDTPFNRDMIASSLSNGWYKVVDKNTREEIINLAKEKGYKIDITPKTEVNIKKTSREISSEKHAKELENRLLDMQEKMERMKKDLEMAKNERMVHVERRLAGTPIVPVEVDKEL